MLIAIEALEHRQLLSANPIVRSNPATIAADRAAIVNDQQIIVRDTVDCRTKVAADHASIPAARALGLEQFRVDTAKLRQDHGNPTLVLGDRAAILLDQKTLRDNVASIQGRIRQDLTSCRRTLATDHSQLRGDQLKLHRDQLAP